MIVFYAWLIAGIIFLMIEFFTYTTYGLGLAIASFITAGYVGIFHIQSFAHIFQFFIFTIITVTCVILFPRLFNSSRTVSAKVGVEQYFGETYALIKKGSDWKVKIEGVFYLIDEKSVTTQFQEAKKIKITGHHGGILMGELIEAPKINIQK